MKHYLIKYPALLSLTGLFVSVITLYGFYGRSMENLKRLQFRMQTDTAYQELNKKFCWFHPLKVSDYYSGLYYMRTDDLGKTWSAPDEIPELQWQYEPDGTVWAARVLWSQKNRLVK